jgi:hypothetical protein
MTQIKIEVPANDHIALSAMADALQRIATERAPSVTTGVTQSDVEQYGKAWSEHYGSNTEQLNDELEHASQFDVELNRLDGEIEETLATVENVHVHFGGNDVSPDKPADTEQDDTLDADGIPHDKRIHSKGATRLADNTWRLRKRPADKTEEEWTAYIDSVKAELKAVQDIPSETTVTDVNDIEYRKTQGVIAPNCEVEVTLDEQAVADLTPPAIDEPATQLEGVTPNGDVAIEPPVTTVGAPVAPVTPPTSLTPPVVEADKPSDQPSVTTFQELMLYMTSDAKKRGADNDMIKATLLEVDPALTAIPLIAARADLIPKFVKALEVKLA